MVILSPRGRGMFGRQTPNQGAIAKPIRLDVAAIKPGVQGWPHLCPKNFPANQNSLRADAFKNMSEGYITACIICFSQRRAG